MKTLLSAEWKERRLVFSSAAALALISNAASRLFAADYEFYAVLTGYYIIPVVFCFFLGAGAFGKKFSGSRKPLLEARPVPGPGIFLARFLSGMVVLATPALVSRLVFGIPFAVPALFSKPLELAGRPLYFFLLPAGVLYSAVCSGSGLFKNRFLAVVSPLVLLPLAVLLVLPLFAVFYLAHPPLFLPLLLASLSIMAALLAPGYAAWRSFAAGDGFPLKKIAVTAVLIGAFSFIVHGVFNLAAGRRMESALRRAAEAGLTAQLEELIPPPVPDEDNAALLYQEAFRAAGELKEKYPELWDYIPYISLTPWDELSAEKRGEVSGVMDEPGFLALFNLLEEAARMPACRFDVRYEDGLAVKLPHLASMRGLMRLSAARVLVLAGEERYREAFRAAAAGLRMGDALSEEPLLISQLVRVALDSVALESAWGLLKRPGAGFSADDYREAASAVSQKESFLTRGFEYEFVMGMGPAYRESWSYSILEFMGIRVEYRENHPGIKLFMRLMSPVLKLDQAFYMRRMIELIGYSRRPYWLVIDAMEEWDKASAKAKYPGSSLTLPALARVFRQQPQYQARLGTALTALSLEIYRLENGYYPESLQALTPGVIHALPADPFTGEPYVYRPEDDGFAVYSVGPSRIDHGGVHDFGRGLDDIVFRKIIAAED